MSGTATRLRGDLSRSHALAILAGAASLLLTYLMFRNIGLGPAVFGDEWTYSEFSRLTPLRHTGIPAFLFSFIFRQTNRCGTSFLECARVLNAFFYVASLPLIYAVARRLVSRRVAIGLALISVLGPVSTYTAFFMPEPLYFTLFWVFAFCATREREARGYAAAAGAALGFMALVKVHAFALLPVFIILLACDSLIDRNRRAFIDATKATASFVVSFLAVRFVLGWMLAGKTSFDVIGTFYRTQASRLPKVPLAEVATGAASVMLNHILLLCGLLSVGCAALLMRLLTLPAIGSRGDDRARWRFALFAVGTLGALVAMTAYFTAAVGSGPTETLDRLHVRYYGFALPLLYMGGCLGVGEVRRARPRGIVGIVVCLVVGSVAAYGLFGGLSTVDANRIDAPEYVGLFANRGLFHVTVILAFAALAAYAWLPRIGARLFLLAYLPVAVIGGGVVVANQSSGRIVPDDYDTAGKIAQIVLGRDAAGVVLLGDDMVGLVKTKFYLDNPSADLILLGEGQRVDRSAIPARAKWLLVIGSHELNADVAARQRFGNVSIYQLDPFPALDFSNGSLPNTVESLEGLSPSEVSGRWSTGNTITLSYAQPLPESFVLHLRALAFGPNIGRPFEVTAGEGTARFVLQAGFSDITLNVLAKRGEHAIKIIVPSAISPKELGVGQDERRLGLMIQGLSIEPASVTP